MRRKYADIASLDAFTQTPNFYSTLIYTELLKLENIILHITKRKYVPNVLSLMDWRRAQCSFASKYVTSHLYKSSSAVIKGLISNWAKVLFVCSFNLALKLKNTYIFKITYYVTNQTNPLHKLKYSNRARFSFLLNASNRIKFIQFSVQFCSYPSRKRKANKTNDQLKFTF